MHITPKKYTMRVNQNNQLKGTRMKESAELAITQYQWMHLRSEAVFLDKDNTSSALMKVHFFRYSIQWYLGKQRASSFLAVWKKPFLCHHDNAPVHKARSTKKWLSEFGRRTWPQPHSIWLNLNAKCELGVITRHQYWTQLIVAKTVQIPVATSKTWWRALSEEWQLL